MPNTLTVDEKLLEEAFRLGGHRTKKQAVNEALQEYIDRRKRLGFLKLSGKVDYDPGWNYKQERKRR
jgi:Arc/MetJ family transcription regulator